MPVPYQSHTYIHHAFILSIMHTILTSIQQYLKTSFREKESADQNFNNVNVTLAPIKKDGQEEGDDITISLLRIEEETSRRPQNVYHYIKDEDKVIKKANPDVCLNLYVLIVSHAQNYETALLEISKVIYWMNSFQSTDCLVELHTLSAEQNNSLWQTLGTEIKPAVVYKVRMLTITSDVVKSNVDVVKKVVLTRDSGFMSLINKKLHGEKELDKDTFMEELTDDERKSLQQAVIGLYVETTRQYGDISIKDDDPDHLRQRKTQLNQWIEDEAWHDNEINRKTENGYVYNGRIRVIKQIQKECLIEALKAIHDKPQSEWTTTEENAYKLAINDKEFKKIFKE